MMPRWTFMAETLELKDGRFRYWFSSDVIRRGGPKYPIKGSYNFGADELVLSSRKVIKVRQVNGSSGNVFKVRQVNGRRALFWPHAVRYWDQRQIIPGHMLLPVDAIDSEPPKIEAFFTEEQIEVSEKNARELFGSK